MVDGDQLPLFEEEQERDQTELTGVTASTPLDEAIEAYRDYMRYQGFALNTIKSFRSDLNLLGKYAGHDTPIGRFGTDDLNNFLNWLLSGRGVPCSPKSYARRVTTLKSFFDYLYQIEALSHDPAAPLIQEPVSSPLPVILHEDEIERLLTITNALRREKPDARPHLLVTLLLQTGIKKSECMAIHPSHIDRDPSASILWVRYSNPRLRYKERKLRLAPDFLTTLDEYLAQYDPPDALFNCTARNLEYVLSGVAEQAKIEKGVSFEMLRWTCAVRDLRAGMDPEKIRQKLGLSRISWRETAEKVARLAETGP
jgi:site-specific recombinase XerD